MPSLYINVKELPLVMRHQLARRGYHKHDIAINVVHSVSPIDYGGDGQKAYCDIVDLASNTVVRELNGSWGGANMFNPTNQVDLDREAYVIPCNGAVIKGSYGYRNFATLYVSDANIVAMIEPPAELSDKEQRIIEAYASLKSGPYRQETLQRLKVTTGDIEWLVSQGYLKQAKNGATSLTTKGKNARIQARATA